MDLKDLLNNKVIICFEEEKNIFLNLKKDNCLLNFTLMSDKEAIESLSFEHDYKTLAEIIKIKNVSLNAAKQIIEVLRFIDEKNDFDDLLNLKKELFDKKLIVEREYKKIFLQRNSILLFNQQNNEELQGFLRKHNINFEFLNPENIGLFVSDLEPTKEFYDEKTHKEYSKVIYTKYRNRFDQFNNICNRICKLLDEEKVNENEIAIRADFKNLSFYFSTFKELYNLKFYYKNSVTLKQFKSVQQKIQEIFERKSFDLEYDIEDENIKKLKEIIDDYYLKLYDFDTAFNLLNELLDTYKNSEVSESGILVTDSFKNSSRKYTFELDFNFDNYPKVFADDKYYNDETLVKLHMNPSYIKTKLDEDKKVIYMAYTKPILSLVEIALSKDVFNSIFVDKYNFRLNEFNVAFVSDYSKLASRLNYKILKKNFKNKETSAKLDELFKIAADPSLNYENDFKITNNLINKIEKCSYTRINSFYECPFKYYCDVVLKISKFKSTKKIDVGNFTHKFLEVAYSYRRNSTLYKGLTDIEYKTKRDTYFEMEFAKALNNKKLHLPENEILFLNTVTKKYIKEIWNTLIDRYDLGNYLEEYSEKEFKLNLENLKLTGKVDSILVSQSDDKKYLTIIDYKTGSPKFHFDKIGDGLSLQLPIYNYMVKKTDSFKDYIVGGLFIQTLFDFENVKKNNFYSPLLFSNALKYNGLYIEDQSYNKSIDTQAADGGKKLPSFIKKEKATNPRPKPTETFKVAEEKLKEFENAVKNNRFNVFPAKLSNEDDIFACKYCEFKNICYKNPNQVRVIENEEEEEE